MKDAPLPRWAAYAIYFVLLLWAGLEILRSLDRLDGVVFLGYVQTGEAVLQHKDPYGYALTLINTWPPFFFFVSGALALMARASLLGALLAWQVLGVAAIWGTLKLCAKLYVPDGDTLTFWPRDGRLSLVSLGVLVPLAMTLRLFQEHVQHTQINVQVLFLSLLAFELFRRGKWAWGGWWLALAVSVKALPVLLVLYLVYKRQWRAVAWTGVFLVGLNAVLPAVVFGPAHALADWQRWRAISARGLLDPTPTYFNQSLVAAMKRLFTVAGSARDPVHYAIAAWPTARVVHLFEGLAPPPGGPARAAQHGGAGRRPGRDDHRGSPGVEGALRHADRRVLPGVPRAAPSSPQRPALGVVVGELRVPDAFRAGVRGESPERCAGELERDPGGGGDCGGTGLHANAERGSRNAELKAAVMFRVPRSALRVRYILCTPNAPTCTSRLWFTRRPTTPTASTSLAFAV